MDAVITSTLAYEIFSEVIGNEDFSRYWEHEQKIWDLQEKLKKAASKASKIATVAGLAGSLAALPPLANNAKHATERASVVYNMAMAPKTYKQLVVDQSKGKNYNMRYYTQKALKETGYTNGKDIPIGKVDTAVKKVKDKYGSTIDKKEFEKATGVPYKKYASGGLKFTEAAKEAKKALKKQGKEITHVKFSV